MDRITFGTSGWRGILADGFTLANVRKVLQAIAEHVAATGGAEQGVVVGYDTRFMGERFAGEAARLFAAAGIRAYLCDRDVPTPVISFTILARKAAGAVNFTASHNPFDYNGIKFSPSWGGPALPETTRDIESRANSAGIEGRIAVGGPVNEALLCTIDPREDYLQDMEGKIDFDAVSKAGILAVNPLYGTARGYLDEVLRRHGIGMRVVNDARDPYFGGFPPEPSERNIGDFIGLVRNTPEIRLGIATDGDADRFGIVDSDGSYIEPNYIIALLLDYLVRVRKIGGGVARSVATTHLIDAVAAHHGIEVFETPVGFKYIGELISQDRIAIGGEESAGLSIRGHVPEKDGILACLLVAEMAGREGMSLKQLLERLYGLVGRFVTRRENIRLSTEIAQGFDGRMTDLPAAFAGLRIKDIVRIDGTKCILDDGSWLLFRKSGTEPVVRLYSEAGSDDRLAAVMKAGREFLLEP